MQVQFRGLDEPVLPQTPAFKKSLEVDVARGDDVIVAYLMNGEPMPLLNGYPVRLIVPGWFATYWVKMLSAITVLDHVDDNFWMKTAYRIPDTPNASVVPGSTGFATVPISKLDVRSFITNVGDGGVVNAGSATLRGIAFDGGSGIRRVEGLDRRRHHLESVGTRTGLRQIQLQAMESPSGTPSPARTS